MKLTNIAIQHAKPRSKTYKIYDGKGLYLEISPNGGKWWRFKYRFNNKEKRISLGTYPEISLSKARELLLVVRSQVAEGIDPSEKRKEKKATNKINELNNLESIARSWWVMHMKDKEKSHSSKVIRRFEIYVFPYIGKRKIVDLTTPDIANVIKQISDADLIETAKRTLQTLGQVFRFAVQQGLADRDVTADLKGFLPTRKPKSMATLLDPKDISDLLNSFNSFRGSLIVRCALELAPLVFARPGELRNAMWQDINLNKREWSYIVKKGGNVRTHTVPLSVQAMEILDKVGTYSKTSKYVFPNARHWNRPMSEAAVNTALKSLGYDTQNQITGHGFRAMARTILHETLKIDPYAIEHQLSHNVPDQLGDAYNRTKFIDARINLMQEWADYLDKLKGINKKIIYYDCEFTKLSTEKDSIDLISAGFITEEGYELYFELSENYTESNCSEFTKKMVIPHLATNKFGKSNSEAALMLKSYIESFSQRVQLATDSPKYDWMLISRLFDSTNCWPSNLLKEPLNVYSEEIAYEINEYFENRQVARRHHAIDDARALLYAAQKLNTQRKYD